MTDTSPLPIDAILPDLRAVLAENRGAVLVAPPGAGKTTRVPLALLEAPWLAGRRIVMQEPRRIAARAAARRMAANLGQAVGETVGYRVRFDSRIGPSTRIEVVTDGLFLRLLQEDPSLDDIGCVIFDELHERGIETDLALALTRESQAALRPDLRIIAMSATLDPGPIAELLGDVPVLRSEGRSFDVETRYLERDPVGPIDETVATAIGRALGEEQGSLLVFLPGVGEIRRVQRRLESIGLPGTVDIAPLYGDLPAADQDRALRPAAAGRRKIVLSTALAESSLTIEDVRIVIDGGEMRVPRFAPRTGMSRLETIRVSQASADQRRGRAGRTAPGVCYRLWTSERQRGLKPFSDPEIVDADLAPLALELAAWGTRDPGELVWLTPPPAAPLAQARDLLHQLGALDRHFAITAHGRALTRIGLHPRLAHMVVQGRALGQSRLAAVIAALLGERDLLRRRPGLQRDADLLTRVDIVLAAQARQALPQPDLDRAALSAVLEMARRLDRTPQRRDAAAPPTAIDRRLAGALVALAYPERLAQRRPGSHRYRLRNGRGAVLGDGTAAPDLIAIADLDDAGADGRIFAYAEISQLDIETLFEADIEESDSVEWSVAEGAVIGERRRRLGALILQRRKLADIDPELALQATMTGIRTLGLDALPWSEESRSLCQRLALLRRILGTDWPDLSPARLGDTLDQWLAPYLGGITRRSQFDRIDLTAALLALLTRQQRNQLDRLAPTHFQVPSGSNIRIDYSGDNGPVLAVRLQEVFGLQETPGLLEGRIPLTLHLLSPAHRPVQVTQDLRGFWRGSYAAVRAELRGRYPKHFWPEDPANAAPTARLRPRPPAA